MALGQGTVHLHLPRLPRLACLASPTFLWSLPSTHWPNQTPPSFLWSLPTGQTKHHLPSCGPCPLAKPNTTYLPVVPVPGASVPSVGVKPGPWDKGLPSPASPRQPSCGPCPAPTEPN